MRIIKPGKTQIPERKFTCRQCNCKFIADIYDTKGNQKEGSYVICPTCQSFITWSTGIEIVED